MFLSPLSSLLFVLRSPAEVRTPGPTASGLLTFLVSVDRVGGGGRTVDNTDCGVPVTVTTPRLQGFTVPTSDWCPSKGEFLDLCRVGISRSTSLSPGRREDREGRGPSLVEGDPRFLEVKCPSDRYRLSRTPVSRKVLPTVHTSYTDPDVQIPEENN